MHTWILSCFTNCIPRRQTKLEGGDVFFTGMAKGHLLLEQGGQQAAQHRRGLPEGHVLFQRCQRQKGKEKSQSM